jgi:hypothetical protein
VAFFSILGTFLYISRKNICIYNLSKLLDTTSEKSKCFYQKMKENISPMTRDQICTISQNYVNKTFNKKDVTDALYDISIGEISILKKLVKECEIDSTLFNLT